MAERRYGYAVALSVHWEPASMRTNRLMRVSGLPSLGHHVKVHILPKGGAVRKGFSNQLEAGEETASF